jgi:hypothetical protein
MLGMIALCCFVSPVKIVKDTCTGRENTKGFIFVDTSSMKFSVSFQRESLSFFTCGGSYFALP